MQLHMSDIRVFNIQRLCVNDGPGVRTVVFLQGCTLQCPWCCNPEGIHLHEESPFNKGVCYYPDKKQLCQDCEKFGGARSILHCPINAYEPRYVDYTCEELVQVLLKDENLLKDGGITLSGGEPLLHIDALIPVLKALKGRGIHIACETTLYVPTEYFTTALQYIDYWIVDLKLQFGYIANNEFEISQNAVYENLELLQASVSSEAITFRMVVMQEAAENFVQMANRLKELNIKEIELLECHSLAENKYHQLSKIFKKFHTPTTEEIDMLTALLHKMNINCQYIKL